MFGIDIHVRHGKVEIVSMLKFEEMACEECQQLARDRQKTYPFPVDLFFETSCSCPSCQKIFQHLMEAHPDVIAIVMLDSRLVRYLVIRQQCIEREQSHHAKSPA